MLKAADKPVSLWEEALRYLALLKNAILATGAIDPTRTPWQLFVGTIPDLKHVKVWGCPGFRFVPEEERKDKTFSDRAEPGYFMGLVPENQRTFLFLTQKWKMKRGTTGVFYESMTRVAQLPEPNRRLEDGDSSEQGHDAMRGPPR